MLILVTRPAAQAVDWVVRLQAKGLAAAALPLIEIEPLADPQPLVTAWQGLAQQQLVFFASPNAVMQFFAARPADSAWCATLAASPGPGTTSALRAAGVPANCIIEPPADAAQFDSESLWICLATHDWADRDVLLVGGEGGRDWLGEQLRASGARVTQLCAYRRRAPRFDAELRRLFDQALQTPASVLWFFSSSEAIGHLNLFVDELVTTSAIAAPRWGHASALTTHPRIAARAARLGIGRVLQTRPGFDEVIACIQSLRP